MNTIPLVNIKYIGILYPFIQVFVRLYTRICTDSYKMYLVARKYPKKGTIGPPVRSEGAPRWLISEATRGQGGTTLEPLRPLPFSVPRRAAGSAPRMLPLTPSLSIPRESEVVSLRFAPLRGGWNDPCFFFLSPLLALFTLSGVSRLSSRFIGFEGPFRTFVGHLYVYRVIYIKSGE